MTLKIIRVKKGEDRRLRSGHPWIFSNEIDNHFVRLTTLTPGEEVLVQAHDGTPLGTAYVNPHSLIAARIFSRLPEETAFDLEYFKQKLQTALALRTQLYDQPFYRLVFSETDELPGLVIDRFNEHLVAQINTAGMELKKDILREALQAVLPEVTSVLLRNDSKSRVQEGLTTYVEPLYGEPPEMAWVEENGARFQVPLWKGQKTGWFYDHRSNRERLRRYANESTVLDVFSYLGAWGIEAAVFGAKSVDCIESSAIACERIAHNAQLNNVSHLVSVINDDAFDALKALIQAKKQYQVIVLDPPAFIKRIKDLKEGLVAYQRINEMALKLLAPNGILITCSCSMHLSMEMLTQVMQRACYKTQTQVQLLERGHQGPDHPIHVAVPETDYLKTLIYRKLR